MNVHVDERCGIFTLIDTHTSRSTWPKQTINYVINKSEQAFIQGQMQQKILYNPTLLPFGEANSERQKNKLSICFWETVFTLSALCENMRTDNAVLRQMTAEKMWRIFQLLTEKNVRKSNEHYCSFNCIYVNVLTAELLQKFLHDPNFDSTMRVQDINVHLEWTYSLSESN